MLDFGLKPLKLVGNPVHFYGRLADTVENEADILPVRLYGVRTRLKPLRCVTRACIQMSFTYRQTTELSCI